MELEEVDTDEYKDAASTRHPSTYAADMAWLAFWLALIGIILMTPHWLWVLRHADDLATPVPVGTVQRVYFISNLGIDSQIDTEERSFMVRGVTQFKTGTQIELRKGSRSFLLCEAEAHPDYCETVMGN